MTRYALTLSLAIALASCATMESGNKFDPAIAAGFQTGVTTRAQVEAALGKPQSVVTSADGGSQLVYVHVVSHANSMTANSAATGNTAAFVFDKDGILQRTALQDINSRTK